MLLNQDCLPNMQQAKCWDTEVCSKEKVYLQGGQVRRWKSQIHFLKGKGLGVFFGIKLRLIGDKKMWGDLHSGLDTTELQASSQYVYSEHALRMESSALWSQKVTEHAQLEGQ